MILTALILTLTGVFNPVDIDVFEGGLLWAAQLEGKIMRSDKFGEDEIKTIQTGLHMPRAVSVYHIYRYDISSELNFLVLNLCLLPASLFPPTCCTTFWGGGGGVAQLVECQVRHAAAGDKFVSLELQWICLPEPAFSADSLTVFVQPLCAIARINICLCMLKISSVSSHAIV